MDTAVQDVNAGAESSTAATGATEASPTSKTTAPESSPAGDKKPSSLSEALEKVQLEMPAEETADAGEPSAETSTDVPPTTEAELGETEADPVTGEKDGKPANSSQGAEAADVPFHTRPEWQTAMKALNSLPDKGATFKPIIREAFQRETRANEALRALKPQADITTELKNIVGGDKEFEAMRQVVRGFAGGDPAVLPILKQMVQSIEKLSGEVISSTDLIERQSAIQKQFDEGMIDQAEFQSQNNLLKEVERTRAGKRQVENKLQTTQSDQQRQQTEAQTAQKVEAINSWENNLRQRDPDFGQVTDPSDVKHGESVADQVFDAMSLKFMQKPNVTNEELIQTAQRAYERARKSVPAPALRQQKVVTSQSSSITGKPKPKTMREAMDAVKLD